MSDSKRWLKEHFKDEYVKKAQAEGYPSRAAYKLLELQKKDNFIKPGMKVLDLGAAPGGWSYVLRDIVGEKGKIIAVDILEMDEVVGVDFILGDFREQETLDKILETVQGARFELVISDMAPNISGVKSVDQPRSMYLLELAFDCAQKVLRPGGTFLVKVFQGEGVDAYIKELRKHFTIVRSRKPKASRARSSEIYVLATGFRL